MTEALVGELLDFGALGVFAAFLVYQHMNMQKRLDLLVESFQGQIRDIADTYDDRIDRGRTRYDDLLDAYRAEHSGKVVELTRKIDELAERLRRRIG